MTTTLEMATLDLEVYFDGLVYPSLELAQSRPIDYHFSSIIISFPSVNQAEVYDRHPTDR